jgi:hypothetical protein
VPGPTPGAVDTVNRSSRGPREAAWEAQLARLTAYTAAHGDCSVPVRWAEDPRLATWVHTQRQLKRRLDRGEVSGGMTAARVAKLEALGFVWAGSKRSKMHTNHSYWKTPEVQAEMGAYIAATVSCGSRVFRSEQAKARWLVRAEADAKGRYKAGARLPRAAVDEPAAAAAADSEGGEPVAVPCSGCAVPLNVPRSGPPWGG